MMPSDKNRSGIARRNAAESVADPAAVSADPSKTPDWNIKYIGRPRWDKGKKKRLDYNAPIERFSDRGEIIELPSPSAQERTRTFYHPDAARIAAAFPHLYGIRRSK